jgi:hypothetical protein
MPTFNIGIRRMILKYPSLYFHHICVLGKFLCIGIFQNRRWQVGPWNRFVGGHICLPTTINEDDPQKAAATEE